MQNNIPRGVVSIIILVSVVVGGSGCRSAKVAETEAAPPWDLDSAEILRWEADQEGFQQDRALEASGLTASHRYLYATSEKYWRVLQITPDGDYPVRVVDLDVPRHTELEGVAFHRGNLYFCDEAHAAVYRVPLPDETAIAAGDVNGKLSAEEMIITGPMIHAGKIGVEGVALSNGGLRLWLLLERRTEENGECVSPIFPLDVTGSALVAEGPPVVIRLEDCNWRLTGLDMWRGQLLALKTQFPGERYELITINPDTGEWRVLLEMTQLLRSVREQGYNNNVEGFTVTGDGTLWMVSDNAWTGIIDDSVPPLAEERTLFMRIPSMEGVER